MSSAVFRRRTRSQIKCFLHRKVIVKKTYCLGTLLLSVLMAAPLALLASQSYYPVKLEDVAVGFRNIEEELRSQYHLVYRPSNLKMDGSFRTIYLQANDPRYHVRAQKGYFSPRPAQ